MHVESEKGEVKTLVTEEFLKVENTVIFHMKTMFHHEL